MKNILSSKQLVGFGVGLLVVSSILASSLIIKKVGAANCTDTATTATVVSKASSAGSGAVICLSSGTYGQLTFSTARSSQVTLRPADGATVSLYPHIAGARNYRFEGFAGASSLGGVDIISNARNIQIVGNRLVSGGIAVFLDENLDAGITIDNNILDNLHGGGGYEGRLSVRGSSQTTPVGVHITNNIFSGGAGCSDGVQVIGAAYGVDIGPGNEFTNIKQSQCSGGQHIDSIQLYGSSHTQIHGNYFHDSDTQVMAPDGGDHEDIFNNVFIGSGAYRPAIQMGHHNGSTFTHNVAKDIDVNNYVSGADSNPNQNIVMRDNVMVNSTFNSSGCVNCTTSYNLFTSGASGTNAITATPIFAGGASPTTHDGYILAAGSPGKSSASDGSDRGVSAAGSANTTPTSSGGSSSGSAGGTTSPGTGTSTGTKSKTKTKTSPTTPQSSKDTTKKTKGTHHKDGKASHTGGSIQADINGDGVVSELDVKAFSAAYGKAHGKTGYNAKADYDGNNVVSVMDLSAFLAYYMP